MAFSKGHNLTKYIRGKGIEIGALNHPLKINCRYAEVVYVDAFNKEDLIQQNPEICGQEIKAPDIVADAEDLSVIADESMNFVIACHVLEHLPNPIRALKEFYRVLRRNGILYLVVPDKRRSFDKERPVTTLAHLLRDYKERASVENSINHYQEWLTLVELKKEKPVVTTLAGLIDKKYRIHFHVWTPDSIVEILNYAKNNFGLFFKLKDYYYYRKEPAITFVLEKSDVSYLSDLSSPIKEKYSLVRQTLYNFESFIYLIIARFRKKKHLRTEQHL